MAILPYSSLRALSTTTPLTDSGTAPTVGASTKVARADHVHPTAIWQSVDYGLISWAFDPSTASNATILTSAGLVHVVKLHIPVATTVTNLHIIVTTAGSTLTASQCLAGLYQSGTLLGTTADQSTPWSSTGYKTMAISGGAVAVVAGDVYVAFFANGTTLPTLLRGFNNTAVNGSLASPNLRFATADSGRTTSFPASMGSQSATALTYWAAVS